MVLVLHQVRAVFRDADVHKLTNDTAEIRRHQKAFEPRDSLRVKLLIDETQEIYAITLEN
jgi:hypothetical protein